MTVLSRSNINVPSLVRVFVSFIVPLSLLLLSLSWNSHVPNVTGMESTQLMNDKGVLFSPLELVGGALMKAEGGTLSLLL